MDFELLLGLLLTILPITELRGGLPLVVDYCLKHSLSVWPWFLIVLILNVLMILVIFLFLDFLHMRLLKLKFYRKFFECYLKRLQKKIDKFEKRFARLGFIALALFVAIPLPGTGAWTGTILAWLLGLERWKSFLAISLGVIIAGIIILFASLGFFSLF